MIKYEEESITITDANNITADVFIHAYSSHRENLDTIFTSEKLEKSDKLVDTIYNSQ